MELRDEGLRIVVAVLTPNPGADFQIPFGNGLAALSADSRLTVSHRTLFGASLFSAMLDNPRPKIAGPYARMARYQLQPL